MSEKTKKRIVGAGNIHQLKAKRENPTLTPLTFKEIALPLIRLRYNIRKAIYSLNAGREKANQYRRWARLLNSSGSPFYLSRIEELEQAASTAINGTEVTEGYLLKFGRMIMDLSQTFDTCTTLAQRCELLNVNVVDRGGLTESDSLVDIIFAHGLEDSAGRRRKDFKEGVMFEALHLVFMDFLENTDNGLAISDSLFEPGGIFESVPMYVQDKDGNMQRQPPALKLIKPTYH